MPNGDNWQGEVLRDLRGSAQPPARDTAVSGDTDQAQGFPPQGDRQPHGAAVPAGQAAAPAPGHPYQAGQVLPPQSGGGQPALHARAVTRTPDSRPAVDRSLAAVGRKPRSGEPIAARAAHTLWRIVSSSASREVADATRTAEVLQQPVTTGRQIAVTSIRGGAGKSTVAALLGTTYAHYRQDPVLFVEADPALGSLPVRLGAEALRWTTGDVADIVEPQMSLLDVTGYLVQLRDNAWLLPGSQGQIGAMLDTRAYERVMVALRRYFGVTVVDCETLPAEVARVALSASQARVLTTPATLDGIASTYAVLQWMQSLPAHVMGSTVVVLTEQSPHSGLDVDEAVRTLRSTGTSVHVLPYDRHLADGGAIRTGLLARATRTTATRIAADVFQLSQKRH
ncbi:CpaE family protein [Streptomyces sp. NPDC090741]|uniref:AAA family ATPase n=1 Tax=Streptomyces sp. NPDC090741 TaxID=3365967 RepID=UPI0037F7CB7A